MGFFSDCLPFNIFSSTNNENEKMKKIEEIRKKRVTLLPFSWKYQVARDTYQVACDTNQVTRDTKENLEENIKKTEKLSEKCEILYDSAKTYQQLTKQLSDKYKQ